MSYGKVKDCNNNCGQQIMWDQEAGYFVNTANHMRHDCPNWKKKQQGGGAAATTVRTAATSEEVAVVHARVTEVNGKLDTHTWLLEQIAKKVGVNFDANE